MPKIPWIIAIVVAAAVLAWVITVDLTGRKGEL